MADQQQGNNDFLAEYRRRQQERWAQEQNKSQQQQESNGTNEEQSPSLVQEEINPTPVDDKNESLDELRQQFAQRIRTAIEDEPVLVEDDNEFNEIDKFWNDEQVKIQQEKADEEYARKLQEEFDAEMAEAAQADENQALDEPYDNARPPQEPFVDRLVQEDDDVPIEHSNTSRNQQQFNLNSAQEQFNQLNNQQAHDDDVIIVQHHNRARALPQQQQVVHNQNQQQNQYLFAQQQQQQQTSAAPQNNSYQVYEQVTQSYNQYGEPIRIRRVVKNHNGNVTSQEFVEPIIALPQQQQHQYASPFIQQQQRVYANVPHHGLVQQQSQVMGNWFEDEHDDFFNTRPGLGVDPMLRRMQRRMNQMAQSIGSSRRRFSSLFNN